MQIKGRVTVKDDDPPLAVFTDNISYAGLADTFFKIANTQSLYFISSSCLSFMDKIFLFKFSEQAINFLSPFLSQPAA